MEKAIAGQGLHDQLDIVIPTARDLHDFLEHWRVYLQPYHLIIIQGGNPSNATRVPAGFDYELYNKDDIQRILGDKSWCISLNDTACRCFGFLVSKKRYVFTLDDDCFMATNSLGKNINPLEQHILNLLTPSTPYFFNTLYDPYREGADFVRGYPFSLREGVPTVISHGLWLNSADYDAATQMVRPLERNTRYVDAVVTVPKGVHYPMSGINLAFDRAVMGPAMYFGMAREGPLAGGVPCEDLWAGWCSKVICDHLGVGVKSGLPYVHRRREASNPLSDLRREYREMFWQEELIPFFQSLQLSPDCTEVAGCYEEIGEKVRSGLGHIDPYFGKLADAMAAWVQCWKQLNPMPLFGA